MDDQLCFVQFPHPGPEHQPDAEGFKDWNRGTHKRKFLKSYGHYVDNNKQIDDDIVFWGEWEPQSCVVKYYQTPKADYPKYLNKPYYETPNDRLKCQNTDPFVFGESFYYTGCRQYRKGKPTQLRHLNRGSLVLFGSSVRSHFVLDTVFVVADYIDHAKSNWKSVLDGRISTTYRSVTIEPWYNEDRPESQIHRLYIGATVHNPLNGMFSFFPCQQFNKIGNGFARPEIVLPGKIKPKLCMNTKNTDNLEMN